MSKLANRIVLIDTFNNRELSTHQNLINAIKAKQRHSARVVRANGPGSYLTYAFRFADGEPIDERDIIETEMELAWA